MGVKIAFGSRASGERNEQMNGGNGGSQMNGGGQSYQNSGGGSQMNGAQNYQNSGGQMAMNAMPHMGGEQMNGGQAMAYGIAASFPASHGPYVPGHHIPVPAAAQMGFLAPLDQMGMDSMYPVDMAEEMRRGRSARTGRFVHRSAMERDEQMRGSGGGSGAYEMGHAEADDEEDDGEVAKLKKKVKKLTRKLHKLEEELEEKEEQGRRKKKKSKREDDDDDDDDEEDEPQKKLGCALGNLLAAFPGVAESVFAVVASPPETWADYLKKADFPGIAKMEFGELMKAVQEKKPLPSLKKELFHTAAALLMVCGKS